MTAQKIPLWSLVQCARREIAMRTRVYPRRVEDGRMKQADADRELAAMTAIYELLQRLEREESETRAPSLDLGDGPMADR